LPFSYETTGTETRFTNRLDPEPRSRNVFAFHEECGKSNDFAQKITCRTTGKKPEALTATP
jgi:type I site-specific restriction endonuclease